MTKHFINPDACTACTICVASCPVAAVTQDFAGPKLTGPARERLRLSQTDVDKSLEYCSNCKSCDRSCPSGVPISTLNMLARARHHAAHPQKLRDDILSHGERMAKLNGKLPGLTALTNIGMQLGKSTGIMDLIGISGKAPLPAYASTTFWDAFKKIKQPQRTDKIVFYPGCFVNYNEPQVGLDFVEVMQRNQIEVIIDPEFTCCGSPLIVNGYLAEGRVNAEKNTALIEKWTAAGYPVITGCPSCSLMLKQEYQELFDLKAAAKNAAHIYDMMEYLTILHEKERLQLDFAPLTDDYIYHAPCHLKVQGFGTPALAVLELIPGLTVENADAGCCGISGCYGFKTDKYEIAMAVGGKLFERLKKSGKSAALSDCGTCRLQITHGSGLKALHPITIVNQSYQRQRAALNLPIAHKQNLTQKIGSLL